MCVVELETYVHIWVLSGGRGGVKPGYVRELFLPKKNVFHKHELKLYHIIIIYYMVVNSKFVFIATEDGHS